MKILYVAYKDTKRRTIVPIEKFHAIDDKGNVNESEPSTIKYLIVEEQRTETIAYSDFLEAKRLNKLNQIVI